MERKKRSKSSVWEFCYANKNFGTFGFEMREREREREHVYSTKLNHCTILKK